MRNGNEMTAIYQTMPMYGRYVASVERKDIFICNDCVFFCNRVSQFGRALCRFLFGPSNLLAIGLPNGFAFMCVDSFCAVADAIWPPS